MIYGNTKIHVEQNVITQLKTIFARFGIPTTMVTDNGPQFDSHEMKEFAQAYEFQHTTTSPYFPQSNGQNSLK